MFGVTRTNSRTVKYCQLCCLHGIIPLWMVRMEYRYLGAELTEITSCFWCHLDLDVYHTLIFIRTNLISNQFY